MIDLSRRLAAACAAVAVIVVIASLALGPATAQSSGPSPSPPPTTLGAEAQAFSNLLDLFDAWLDARAKLRYAGICGSASDVADAYDAVQAARAALDRAMEQYIRDFSDQLYAGPVDKMKPADQARFEDDWDDLFDDLYRADKKQHPVGDCPSTPVMKGPPEKKPDRPAPPLPSLPADCFTADSDRREMVADLQRRRMAADGDPAAIDAAIVRAGAIATCPAKGDGGILGHVTIGVGVGGDGHHRHDGHNDDHQGDRPRD